ncbi:hypothetical protein JCM3774_006335 [Rhodotorula dairenensis]
MPRPRTRSPFGPLSADSDSSSGEGAHRADCDDAQHAAWVNAEYPALKDCVYLDHAAAPPAPATPIAALAASIQSQLLSNPHSASTSGIQSALVTDRTRTRVLQDLFDVPDDRLAEWDVVFTHGGATQGIKLVGDAWNWSEHSEDQEHGAALEYLVESHTSLVGLRGYPLAHGRTVRAHRTPSDLLLSAVAQSRRAGRSTLYAYPAQCNATGARLGLRYAAQIKRANPDAKVLVDAAAYCSTSVLDLGALPADEAPDFVVASVYKIFGFPTSLGLLLVRRASAHLLMHSPYFGGGTISSLSLSAPFSHVPRVRPASVTTPIRAAGADASKTDIHTILEAGTPPFLEIVALSHALDWLDDVTHGEGLGAVSRRTKRLRDALTRQLSELRHADGSEVFVEHGAFRDAHTAADKARYPELTDAVILDEPGPILGFSLRLPGHPSSGDGRDKPTSPRCLADFRTAHVGHVSVSRLALVNGIALRSGGLCNTGVWTRVWGLDDVELRELERSGRKCWDEEEFVPFAPYRPLGITRISLGMASTMEDVRAFVAFVKKFFVHSDVPGTTSVSAKSSLPGETFGPRVCTAALTELMLYPIKSCAAQQVADGDSWPLTSSGLLFDREFMLVSASTGRALSQKRYPRMALIHPRVDLARGELVVEARGMPPLRLPLSLLNDDEVNKAAEVCCRLKQANGSKQEQVLASSLAESCLPPTPPLSDEEESSGSGKGSATRAPLQPQVTNLCGTAVASVGVSPAADAWFTAFLNPAPSPSSTDLAVEVDPSPSSTSSAAKRAVARRDTTGPGPVELHRLPSGSARHAHFDTHNRDSAGPPLPLRLSNESPLLLVSEESLGALNGWIQQDGEDARRSSAQPQRENEEVNRVRAQSFRPNLVVGTTLSSSPLEPFWEERIDGFTISRTENNSAAIDSQQSFSTLGKCRRCLMVAVDQITGERTAEPLQTLTRRKKAADTGRVEFGMHCMWREPESGVSAAGGRASAVPDGPPRLAVGDLVTFSLL